MDKILFINGCVREGSRTRRLAQSLLDRLDGEITEVNLDKANIQPLNGESLKIREELSEKGRFDSNVFFRAREFADADIIVIAAPFWEMSFPAIVRAYIENVSVTGIAFAYNEQGIPVGLCKARKLYYVLTAGGPTEGMNYGFEYLKGLCGGMMGIPEIECIKAENLDIIGNDPEAILKEAML